MNLFVLDENPIKAARFVCDKHVVKMVTETAQILSTVLHTYKIELPGLYRSTHKHHPVVLWAGTTISNFKWTLIHGLELGNEYTRRYHRQHKSSLVLDLIRRSYNWSWGIPLGGLTPFSQCLPEEMRGPDAVQAYRLYYHSKSFANWSYSEVPHWWRGNV